MQGSAKQNRIRSRKSQNGYLNREIVINLSREQSLNKVAQTISSSLDLPTVLKTITRLAADLLRADASYLALLTPDRNHLIYPYFYNLPLTSEEPFPRGSGIAWQIVESGEPVHLRDYTEHPDALPFLLQAGIREFIGVPVLAGEIRLGVLAIFNLGSQARFSRRDIALAESVGRQAGVAIQNAQHFRAAQRRAEEAETLRQAASAIATDLNLEQVLDRILINLEKVIQYDSAALFLEEYDTLCIVAGRGFSEAEQVIGRTFPANNPLFEETIETFSPLILADAALDERFEEWSSQPVHGWMAIPMQLRGRTIGFLTVDNQRPNAYSPVDATLAQAFANEATIAIENARLFQEAQLMAITDSLTGISNRRHFLQRGKSEFEHARQNGHPLTAIMFDLDNFKRVNDAHGHAVGDQVLRELAQSCRNLLRASDLFGRVGGEEFIALLPNTCLEQAQIIAERLQNTIALYELETSTGQVGISASFGVTEMTKGCKDLDRLLIEVDQTLYASKGGGKNKITIGKNGGNN